MGRTSTGRSALQGPGDTCVRSTSRSLPGVRGLTRQRTPAASTPGAPGGWVMAPEVCRATSRVQLHAGFGLTEAAALADYLTQLGVSHLYSSPYLPGASGSTHAPAAV